MTVEEFFSFFLEELEANPRLGGYYKFRGDARRFLFRKAYFCQRLQYVLDSLGPNRQQAVWDCGCGYGTTALFLALNGYQVFGTTLEFYFAEIEKRKAWWSRHGEVSSFQHRYEDLFEADYTQAFDAVIVQDVLHHVEPISEGLQRLHASLRSGGRLIVVEENGANLIQNLKLIKQRGFKKTISVYDERLKRTVLLGNENIRSLAQWRLLLGNAGFTVDDRSVEYIRFFLPPFIKQGSVEALKTKESRLAKQSPLLKNFFFFGVNFTAAKK